MGQYANKAKFYANKIQRLYDHGGSTGYTEAKHDMIALSTLMSQASGSKRGVNDVTAIRATIEWAKPLVAEMKARQDEAMGRSGI